MVRENGGILNVMEITDEAGGEIGYLPIELDAGEESPVISLTVTPANARRRLAASPIDADIKILGRIAGGGAYADLSLAPIDVGAYFPGSVSIEIKVRAEASLIGLRHTLFSLVSVSGGGQAGY
jgi:hypothetical protein